MTLTGDMVSAVVFGLLSWGCLVGALDFSCQGFEKKARQTLLFVFAFGILTFYFCLRVVRDLQL
jgi:hypothetical protein